MNTPVLLERTDACLTVEWRGGRAPVARKGAGAFVTISREAGSGGASFGRILARLLNRETRESDSWNLFEGNVLSRMLRANRLPTRFARFLPEDHVSEINASIGELVGLHPSLWELVQKTNETMRQLARGGQVILVGRGANFATAGIPGGVHVRLVAPAAHRARYLAELYNISDAEARVRNAKCDAARRRYVKDTFNADVEDFTAYDLVINTAQVPLAEAAGLVAAHVRARAPSAHQRDSLEAATCRG